MSEAHATHIRFEDDRTLLHSSAQLPVVVPVGARSIARTVLRHDPPTPAELEQAIDRVEDALMATGLRQSARRQLVIRDAALMAPLGLRSLDEIATRDEVEMAFQRLASVALGQPLPTGTAPLGREPAAILLILREFMHHLGYEGVRVDGSRPSVNPPHYN
jgi:hypothetical protein